MQRATHTNTSYELAQFEVPAQRWADLSEPDFGVTLINDSKYGYACHGSVLSLSLLRAPKDPDPEADMGQHSFTYALLPHAINPQLSAIWWPAAQFNMPLTIVPGLPVFDLKSFVQVDAPNIVLDTIKIAEDNDDLILRFYEAAGSQTVCRLMANFNYDSIVEIDLLERDLHPLKNSSRHIDLLVKPFEIKSLRFQKNKI